MLQALSNALETSDSLDICVGYFYFSGFELLAEKLRDKKIRILVGMEIDPTCVDEIVHNSREREVSLERYAPRTPTVSALQLKKNYVDALIAFVNGSDTFDTSVSENVFEMFISKIKDGSLEIRKTKEDFHGKFYLIHNKSELSQNGDAPGTLFTGSSNFTYRGLIGQGEMNDPFRDAHMFNERKRVFEELWEPANSISIVEKGNEASFITEIMENLWIYKSPKPYEMYIRVLHELYGKISTDDKFKSPNEQTRGLFLDFEYQLDAIKMALDRIKRFDGAIIADVVGLGKSIIASSVAANLEMNTVVIAPPHLIGQWEDYKEQFGIKGSKVFSSGNVREVYERYQDSKTPLLLVIDEAHRFRNEDTNDYKMLHQITRSHPSNKVLLLTATPFNNSPQDIFALMKLFQTPGQATIRSVDNLSLRFRELIQKYKKLRLDMRKSPNSDFSKESSEIAVEQRRFLEPIIIRRSRLDLDYVTRYKEDLKRQNISFPQIIGPTLLEYDLGDAADLYIETLSKIDGLDASDGFVGARYKPATYLRDPEGFSNRFGDIDSSGLKVAQTNLADFMRKLLVMRFESSKFAFKTTLERMIQNNRLIQTWWDELGIVPIMKKGNLPDPSDFELADGEFSDELENQLEKLRSTKGLLEVPSAFLDEQYMEDVRKDTELLEGIWRSWFSNSDHEHNDPKVAQLREQILDLQKKDQSRKIVVFTTYADTANYVATELTKQGISGVLKYTASDASKENRKTLVSNFDASFDQVRQENGFQVLVCTDALSEGVNLNRAGVIVNFDIPYNPTRVIQRIGRLNRINKKMFENILIFNFFPTLVGEAETRLKAISTLKIGLINSIIGSDTRTLTPEEDLETFFKSELESVNNSEEEMSWDTSHLEEYEKSLNNKELLKTVSEIPRRSRISRESSGESSGIIFSKRGENAIFINVQKDLLPKVVSAETALAFFRAKPDEEARQVSESFPQLFAFAKEKLLERHPVPEIRGRRKDALQMVEAVRIEVKPAEVYCSDLERVIREYDDVSEGALKELSQLKANSPEELFEKIKAIIPESFVRNVLSRIDRMQRDGDIILLAEEFV